MVDSQYFFCRAVDQVGEKGECGNHCNVYEPRNGKSGCCKSYSPYVYEPTEKVILTIKK